MIFIKEYIYRYSRIITDPSIHLCIVSCSLIPRRPSTWERERERGGGGGGGGGDRKTSPTRNPHSTHTPHMFHTPCITPHTSHKKFESEAVSLKASLESTLRDLEEVQSSSQHRVRQLTQQLETAKVAIQEMEGAQDHCSELEREVAEVRGALNSKDTEICQLELVSGLHSHLLFFFSIIILVIMRYTKDTRM